MKSAAAKAKAIVDAFDWASYNEEVRGEAGEIFGNVVSTAGDAGAARAGGRFDNEDPFVQRTLTGYVGDMITSVDDTTKATVADLIQAELEAGAESPEDLGDKILDLFDGWADWRADTIARTETATAYNFGNLFGYKQSGVEEVEVSDGDDDEECAAADGQTWTVEEALANPLAHPNCERDFIPVLPGAEEEDGVRPPELKWPDATGYDDHGRDGPAGPRAPGASFDGGKGVSFAEGVSEEDRAAVHEALSRLPAGFHEAAGLHDWKLAVVGKGDEVAPAGKGREVLGHNDPAAKTITVKAGTQDTARLLAHEMAHSYLDHTPALQGDAYNGSPVSEGYRADFDKMSMIKYLVLPGACYSYETTTHGRTVAAVDPPPELRGKEPGWYTADGLPADGPPEAQGMRTEVIKIRVTPAERQALQQLARQSGADVSDFIRQAVNSAAADSSDGPPPLRLGK